MQAPGKTKSTLAERCVHITNLYIAYVNTGKCPSTFGREFFYAVGEILSGTDPGELEVFHIPKIDTTIRLRKEHRCRKRKNRSRSRSCQ